MSSLFKILGIVGLLVAALWLQSPSDDLRPQSLHFENPAPQAILAKEYHFKLSANEDPFPTISGTTDLPEGTKLFIDLLKPHLPNGQQRMAQGLPACEDDCFPGKPPACYLIVIRSCKMEDFRRAHFTLAISRSSRTFTPSEFPSCLTPLTEDNVDVMNHPVYVSEIRIPNPYGSSRPRSASSQTNAATNAGRGKREKSVGELAAH